MTPFSLEFLDMYRKRERRAEKSVGGFEGIGGGSVAAAVVVVPIVFAEVALVDVGEAEGTAEGVDSEGTRAVGFRSDFLRCMGGRVSTEAVVAAASKAWAAGSGAIDGRGGREASID
jgi:hypothetical protein